MNKQEIRRAVIREWMALPHDKRQTEENVGCYFAQIPDGERRKLVTSIRHPKAFVPGTDEQRSATWVSLTIYSQVGNARKNTGISLSDTNKSPVRRLLRSRGSEAVR
jgi:hypothetical protein